MTDIAPERVLVLAPRGRDAVLSQAILAEVGVASRICHSLAELVDGLNAGAGLALVTEEALQVDRPQGTERRAGGAAGLVGFSVHPAHRTRRRSRTQSGGGALSRPARQCHGDRAPVSSDDAHHPDPVGVARPPSPVRGAGAAGGLGRERAPVPDAGELDPDPVLDGLRRRLDLLVQPAMVRLYRDGRVRHGRVGLAVGPRSRPPARRAGPLAGNRSPPAKNST